MAEGASREEVLVAAGRAVIATLAEAMDARRLPPAGMAALRLLEAALEPYEAC